MTRLRQQYPQNYLSSGNINTEFENLIRYLNSAELGGKTVGELFDVLFNDDGEFDGPIEFRLDSSAGLQWRVGEYDNESDGWTTIVDLDSLRGASGSNVGDIGAPILYSRYDEELSAAQTDITYSHDATDNLLVWIDGVLQREGGSYDYTADAATNTITLNTPAVGTETLTVYKIRADDITGFVRTDWLVGLGGQAVFAFAHEEDTQLQVYRNGILQREGGSHDYISSYAADTVTFTSTIPQNDTVTIITVENVGNTIVTGLMLEEDYTDTGSGLILYSKLTVSDDEIPQAKVNGLVTALDEAPKLTVSASTPVSPSTGDLWLNTAVTPNELNVYDGTQFLSTTPDSSLPTYSPTNAGQQLHVNGTGTGLEFTDYDDSHLVPKTYMGASNGVASLDSSGRLPTTQLPEILASGSMHHIDALGANGTANFNRIFKHKIEITGIALVCTGGSCDVTIQVGNADVGSTYSVNTSTPVNATIGTPHEVDASSTNQVIGYRISNASTLAGLEIVYSYNVLSS